MNNDKTCIITMSRRAGDLVMGMDMVKGACADGRAKGVFVTTDISAKSLKEVRFSCAKAGVRLWRLEMTMDDMDYGVGRRAGVIAMTNAGFAKSCAKGLEEIPAEKENFDS